MRQVFTNKEEELHKVRKNKAALLRAFLYSSDGGGGGGGRVPDMTDRRTKEDETSHINTSLPEC